MYLKRRLSTVFFVVTKDYCNNLKKKKTLKTFVICLKLIFLPSKTGNTCGKRAMCVYTGNVAIRSPDQKKASVMKF